MERIALDGTPIDETAFVNDLLTSGDSLVLTWGDDETSMDISPDPGASVEEYIQNTLKPALSAVTQGCFDLWRSGPPPPLPDMDDLVGPLPTNPFD